MSERNIQVFKPQFAIEETLAEIRQCLERGWTGAGFKTAEFEEAWKAATGLPHAHFLCSATAALHIAVAGLRITEGWQAGDEIITTAMTFVSSNHVILYEGLVPVFADIDAFGCLDPAEIERRITARTRAVMFVGLGGNTGALAAVSSLCRRRGLKLILDAAHMSGTTLNGQCPALLADVACYSFQAVKNLPTGDAGMICCAGAELDRLARKLAWLGISQDTFARTGVKGDYKWMYDVEHVGFKYNGNAVMAAIALVALRHLEAHNAYRRRIADWYAEVLGDVPGIEQVPLAPGCTSARHLYQILVENREPVLRQLYAEGIFPGVHYRDNTEYRMYSHARGTLPRTQRFSERVITLPIHLHLGRDDVERVARAVTRAVARAPA